MTHPKRPQQATRPTTYEIVVAGDLPEHAPKWLKGVVPLGEVSDRNAQATVLQLDVQDQAALRGVLNQLWDLNLSLISVRRIHPDSRKDGESDD